MKFPNKMQNLLNAKKSGKKLVMINKKRIEDEPETSVIFIILVIVVIILGVLVFKNPSITGRVIQAKETIYSDNLNLKINESGAYEWNVKNPGNIKSLKVTGSVTSNGTAKVFIEKNGTKQLLFDSTKQLFDVDIHVLPEYKKILQGDEMLVQIVLFNLRGFGSGNINVKYAVKDQKKNFIAAEEETVFVQTQGKFVRKLVMPPEIEPGTFTAFVETSTNGTIVGTGSDTFEIMPKYKQPSTTQLRYYLIGLASVIAFVIILLFGVYEFQRSKKKKDIAKIKEKIPLERIEKLEKELKALEEATKSGLISGESYKKEKKRIEDLLGIAKK